MAMALAASVDGIFIVVSEGMGNIQERIDLKNDLEQAGGTCLGIIYNRAATLKPREKQRLGRRLVKT
jgi:hypothetical protein